MKKRILHLYGDVMNLYGEYANVSVLARFWQELGFEVSVDTLSLYEQKDISGYDFYYMGAGTERKMKLLLPELLRYRETLQQLCDEGKVMLFTGNACDLLGKQITDASGKCFDALGIGDFVTLESAQRITGDCLGQMEGMSEPIVGFINKCSANQGVETPLFSLRMGCGNEKGKKAEGFCRNCCLGTHVTGPILVKNPAFLRYVSRLVLGDAVDFSKASYPYMEKGYEVTKNELLHRLSEK